LRWQFSNNLSAVFIPRLGCSQPGHDKQWLGNMEENNVGESGTPSGTGQAEGRGAIAWGTDCQSKAISPI